MKKIFLFFALLFTVCATAQTIHTVAGNGGTSCGTDGVPATATPAWFTFDVAVDGLSNIYITDSSCIRKVNASGIISTIAGHCGVLGYSGDDGPATDALLGNQESVTVDGAGNVYISDNGRIRKINTSGIISKFAGNGIYGFSGDGGPATAASLSTVYGEAVDASGNVYIADFNNYRIRKVNTSGIISTYAGNGGSGHSGDGSPATDAAIGGPRHLTFDGAGNLYFTDAANNLVRKISASGIISAVAGNGTAGYIDGCPATAAELNLPTGIAVDGAGNIYVGDWNNNRIRQINTSGFISTYAGNGSPGFDGDGGLATAAMLRNPSGVATDAAGNVYFGDANNYRVRVVTPASTPVFDSGSPQSLVVCENSVANGINSLLTVTDTGVGVTETYSVTVSPAHGAITAGGAVTTGTSGTSVAPTGWAYTPATGYSGTDTFAIQVSNGANTAATTIYVTVNPLPVAGAITGATMLCVGAPAALSDTATGGVWSSATTGVVVLSGSAGSTVTVTGIAAGMDTVYYSVTNSCGTAVVSAVVTVNPLPVAGSITGATGICPGGTDTLADTAAGGAWSSATTGIATVSGSAGSSVSVTGIAAGIDTVYYRVTNSCGTAEAFIVVTVNPLPVIDPIIGPDTVCITTDPIIPITLTDSSSGGAWAASNVNASVTSGLVTGMSAGTDTIFYSISNICGTDTAAHIVIVKACTEEVTNINTETTTLTIFPNPNEGFFILSVTTPTNEQASITITNILGEKVKQFTATTNTPTQVIMNMPEGVYFISATTAGGRWNEKVVVSNR